MWQSGYRHDTKEVCVKEDSEQHREIEKKEKPKTET